MPKRQQFRSLNLRAMIAVLILATTAVPFEMTPFDLSAIDFTFQAGDIAANILGYIPVGVIFAGFGAFRAILAAAVLSLSAETAQIFIVGRSPSPIDLFSNIAGALLGVLFHRRWSLNPIPIGKTIALASALLAVVILALIISPARTASLTHWKGDAWLTAGDEPSGGHGFGGEIRELAIAAAALDSRTIQELASASSFQSLQAPTVFGPISDLNRGVIRKQEVLGPPQIQEFHDRITEANAFTVLARFRPDPDGQARPGQIVTYSDGRTFQNFFLSQYRDYLMFFVRVRPSTPEGVTVQWRSPVKLQSHRDYFVAAVFDRYAVRLFVDGAMQGRASLIAGARGFRALGEIALSPLIAVVGFLLAVAAAGVCRSCGIATIRIAGLALGVAGGIALLIAIRQMVPPSYAPWSVVLMGAGSLAAMMGISDGHTRE